MITIRANNGTKGSGETIAAACHALVDDRALTVQIRRGHFVSVEEVGIDDVRRSGMLWASKNGSRHVVALLAEVTEQRAVSK